MNDSDNNTWFISKGVVVKYRDIELTEDKIGSFSAGSAAKKIVRYSAKANGETVRGTLDEVKAEIDRILGPEEKK